MRMPTLPAATRAAEQMPQMTGGQMPQIELAEMSDAEFVAMGNAIATNDEVNYGNESDLWRWERFGHGKYRGRYYRWRRSGDTERRTLNGGRLDLAGEANLPARKGRGNHTRGAAREKANATKKTIDTSRRDSARVVGNFVADAAQRTEGGLGYAVSNGVA